MTPHSSKITLLAKWHQGWALMHAAKISEGYDLLFGIKLSDLRCVDSSEQPDRVVSAFDHNRATPRSLKRRRTAA